MKTNKPLFLSMLAIVNSLNEQIRLLLFLLFGVTLPLSAQIAVPNGLGGISSGPVDLVQISTQTKIVNVSGRSLLLERDDEDSWLTFHDPNNWCFSLGLDYSDGRKFKINSTCEIGSNSLLSINPANGFVGIGNDNPQSYLHVGKSEAAAGTSGGLVRLSLQPFGHTGGPWNFFTRDNSQYAFLDINYGSVSAITVNSSGNVGLGNSSPQANLHVGKQEAAPGTSGEVVRLSIQPYGHNGGPWNFKARDNAQLATLDIQYGTLQTMTFDSNGNVGIGTADPRSFKLAVQGKIWTQEVNVQMTNPGPDYVFEKDYNLLPLSEVETYINQNKHLPEVPSAKEMEKDGLNLKEMNLLLLKKVEELTLHLIEQSKINLEQRDINQKLIYEIETLKNK